MTFVSICVFGIALRISKEIRLVFTLQLEFKDFKDTIERDFREELRDIKAFLTPASKEYEEIRNENQGEP